MKNKKGATSLSIVLLVIFTFILIGFAIFTFISKQISSEKFFYQNFRDLYIVEEKINFYLAQGIDLKKSMELIDIENGEINLKGQKIKVQKVYFENGKKKRAVMGVVYIFEPKVTNKKI